MNKYIPQEHSRRSPKTGQVEVYAITLWSERRQAKKKLRRALGNLSGRQLVKLRKSSQCEAQAA